MTTLRSSQLFTMGVVSGAAGLRASQLMSVGVLANPAAAGLRTSQLFTIAVVANNKPYRPIDRVYALNCWTPCGVLLWNGV